MYVYKKSGPKSNTAKNLTFTSIRPTAGCDACNYLYTMDRSSSDDYEIDVYDSSNDSVASLDSYTSSEHSGSDGAN